MTRIAPENSVAPRIGRPLRVAERNPRSARGFQPDDTRVEVGRVPFYGEGPAAASAWLLRQLRYGWREGLTLRFANAYSVASAANDATYRRLLADSGHNFPDGLPVTWFMKAADPSLPHGCRVRGPSFFRRVLDEGRAQGVRHYFLGATRETLAKMIEQIERDYPGVIVAGSYAPPFANVEDLVEMSEQRVRRANADIVWVGLGSPKQDFVATELNARTGVPTAGVGAAFDFVAGTVDEAPQLVQKLGLEWIFRFVAEPRRLWKRYVFGNVRFLATAIRHLSTARTLAQRQPVREPALVHTGSH